MQLNLKYTIFCQFLYGEAVKIDWLDQDSCRIKVPKMPTLTKRIISGFFDFYNCLLGSLSDVIPMVESIREFKDMVHFEIKYGNK